MSRGEHALKLLTELQKRIPAELPPRERGRMLHLISSRLSGLQGYGR